MRCTQFRNPFLRWTVGAVYVASFTAMLVKGFFLTINYRYGMFFIQIYASICGTTFVGVNRSLLGISPKKAAKPAVKRTTP